MPIHSLHFLVLKKKKVPSQKAVVENLKRLPGVTRPIDKRSNAENNGDCLVLICQPGENNFAGTSAQFITEHLYGPLMTHLPPRAAARDELCAGGN